MVTAIQEQVISNMKAQVKIYESRNMLVNFPNHDSLLRAMYQALDNVSKVPVMMNPDHTVGQTFTRVHHMWGADTFFTWSIPILDQISKSRKPRLGNFRVKKLMEYVSVSELDKGALLQAAQNKMPIYVIEYECGPETESWAVDGNHRIADRYAKNPNDEISGYLFPSSLHMEALIYDYMRVVYAVRTNINRAFGYCVRASDLGYFPSEIPELLPMV